MNNVTRLLTILGALVVAISPSSPLLATPTDEITRAVAVRGLSDPTHAPPKEFITAFTAVVFRAEPAKLPSYVAAAVKLRPDLAPKIVALAVKASYANWHANDAMPVSSSDDRKKSRAELCELVTDIVKAAVVVTPDTVAEIAAAAAGASRDMRECIIAAAVSAVPDAESKIIQAVNAATVMPPSYGFEYGPLNPSDIAGVVVSPEKPPLL